MYLPAMPYVLRERSVSAGKRLNSSLSEVPVTDTPGPQPPRKWRKVLDMSRPHNVQQQLSVEEEEEGNEYEQRRRRNIRMKEEMLKALGFNVENIPDVRPQKKSRKPSSKLELPPLQLNLRSRNPIPQEPAAGKPRVAEEEEDEEEVFSVPMGPSPMFPLGDNQHMTTVFHKVAATSMKTTGSHSSLDDLKHSLQRLSLTERQIMKVGKTRTTALTTHPAIDRILVAAGDKEGNIGFWDVPDGEEKEKEDADQLQVFRPHSAAVFCLTFSPFEPAHMYMTSINGRLRRCDLHRLVFEDVYSSNGCDRLSHTTWHCEWSRHSVLVARGDGAVVAVDNRSPQAITHPLYKRSVRTVHIHPQNDNYWLTASGLGMASVWDVRQLGRKTLQPLVHLQHPNGLKSAFFSPDASLLLTTCNDNKLRTYDCSDLSSKTFFVVMSTNHNINTGQWLTPFKALWHPSRSDAFIIGSMASQRSVAVIGCHGLHLCSLQGPLLQTVLSCCHFHPSRNVVVGANSSGRVHVFMETHAAD